jgi:hypothetical protein
VCISSYCDVPSSVNLRSELLWLHESLVVMTNNVNSLLVIAVLLSSLDTLTFPWLRIYLMYVKLVQGERLREKILLEQVTVKHMR